MCIGADEEWMRKAIEVARSKGSDPSTSPLGCVIVLDGKVIAAERKQTQELPDATTQAEMMAIRRASEGIGELGLRGPSSRCRSHPNEQQLLDTAPVAADARS